MLIPGSLLFLPTLATAAPAAFQSLEQLDASIAAQLGQSPGAEGGARNPLDRRLRLMACPDEPQVVRRNASLAIVHCAALGWQIAVPLIAPAQAARAIVVQRGDALQLTIRRAGFTVNQQLIADRSGAVGDQIPARADRKSAPVMVEIAGSGRAILPAFAD
ncbi:MAG: flagella basal body P-ring formation protein FlgA [Parasphingorhabdus sp.]|nr:flagella basal body P-ring formation protein FlgA [Parasphingorhabdus sp.]